MLNIAVKLGQTCIYIISYLQTGKEYYFTLVNSLWPDSDPFEALVDRPGIRIYFEWVKQGLSYVFINIDIGIWIWVMTWKVVVDIEDNYAKLLATIGLVACIINNISCLIGVAFAMRTICSGMRS